MKNLDEKFDILVVDDNPINLKLISDIIPTDKYNIRIAKSGESCLEVFTFAPADLILLDIEMPGISGLEVCKKIRASDNNFNVPIIFLTANNEESLIAEAFKVGGSDYISKPFSTQELLVRVESQLNSVRIQNLELVNRELCNKKTMSQYCAHEIINPLSLIYGYIDILESNKNDKDLNLYLNKIRIASVRIEKIVRKLKEIDIESESKKHG